MKTFYHATLAAAAFMLASALDAQNFTWMKGSNNIATSGNYGFLGSPNNSNFPGARESMAYWKDSNGKFWAFGGYGYDQQGNAGVLNDMWRYDPTTNQWTWMKGDIVFLQTGKYGTKGVATSTTNPGARQGAAAWTDNSGNLWLFGGYGYGKGLQAGYLNDLWKYDPLLSQWTWMSGADTTYSPATYGTMGTPAATNIPGARNQSLAWKDGSGGFWLFGGMGITNSPFSAGLLNDLWHYEALTNEWTWKKGSNLLDEAGMYGTQGSSSPANTPGGREAAMGWIDQAGKLWLMGGEGYGNATAAGTGFLGDMWHYDITSGDWTWIKGSNGINQQATYGTLGVAAGSNMPGARAAGYTIRDAAGSIWLFGGEGHEASANSGELNDLWKYNATSNEWTWIKGPSIINQGAIYGAQLVPAAANRPGARHDGAAWIDGANNLWIFGGDGYPAGSNNGLLNDVWKYNNCYINPISLSITATPSISCAGAWVDLTASGSDNYTWQTGPFGATIAVTPTATTTYTVYSSGSNNCLYSAAYTHTVVACSGITENAAEHMKVYPNPASGSFIISVPSHLRGADVVISDLRGRIVLRAATSGTPSDISCELAPGVYVASMTGKGDSAHIRIVVMEQ